MPRAVPSPLTALLLPRPHPSGGSPSSDPGPFTDWLKAVSPELNWDWPHLDHVRDRLADVTLGDCRKLAIAWPPQHYKTWSTTVRYPLWRMLREPGLRVGVGTYNQRYANKISRWTRRLVERLGVPFGDAAAVDSWTLANGSSYIARGAGVGLAGEPVDLWVCLPGETRIHTQLGLMRIDDIATMKDRPALLSYNHATGGLEYRQVTGASVTYADRLYEFTDTDGRTFRCTGSHRVFTRERGYIRADRVQPGETFVAVPGVLGPDGQVQQTVPDVPLRPAAIEGGCHLFALSDRIHPNGRGGGESGPPVRRVVLLDAVPQRLQPGSAGEAVRTVWPADRQENQALLRPVPGFSRVGVEAAAAGVEDLQAVWPGLPPAALPQAVLLPRVCQRSTLDPDAGGGQLALQDRHQLRQTVPGDAPARRATGRVRVCPVRQAGAEVPGEESAGYAVPAEQPDRTPHRRGCAGQHAGEPGDAVPSVPPSQPPLEVSTSTVLTVQAVRTVRQPVYDLTVDGNRNFFANGVLVHNCDDPFKNREAADSPVVQEKVYEWHMDDVTPRIQQGGACVVIHTRWNPGDLIGRLQQSEDWPNWAYVRLPAVAESQAERDAVAERQNLPKGLPDPIGRGPGEPLCVGAFDAAALADKRRVLGVGFETLYQQNDITRGGSFFARDWFRVRPVEGEKVRRVRYWDLAKSRKDTADYTSGVLVARAGERDAARYWVEDVVRGRWSPGERNDVMRQTAEGDATRPGFERTWFESPAFDRDRAAARAIVARLAGLPCRGDDVGGSSGSKQVRAEPVSDAARCGLVSLVAGPWNAAFLTELEGFPKAPHDDQVDSLSGAFNKLTRAAGVRVIEG